MLKGTFKAKDLKRILDKAEKKISASAKEALQEATLAVHETAVKSIQNSSGGERQVRYGPTRTVTASKPGSPPNTDTGRLVQSIQFEFLDNGASSVVGTNVKYGKYLEFGTSKMAARPWLQPAFDKNKKKIEKLFFSEVNKEVRKL